jgi:hypothetical protein
MPLLYGCGSPTLTGSDAYVANVKSVGVVSLIGDTFYESRLGITRFGNSSFSGTVRDWAIEDFAAQRTLAYLKGHGGFKAVALERGGVVSGDLLKDDRQLLWELARRQGVDALVAIIPDYLYIGPGFGLGPGYGIFDNASLKGPDHCVYLIFEVDLLDVASHQRKAWQSIHTDCKGLDKLGDETIPFQESFDGYSAQDKKKIRHILETRIANSMRETLAYLHLF